VDEGGLRALRGRAWSSSTTPTGRSPISP
jgi:hypothetical protein